MGTERPYSTAFFEEIREGCQRSAGVVVPRFLEHFRPESVVDVGCGEGWWGEAFQRHTGCEVLGLDGEYAAPVIPWEAVDLTTGAAVGSFDLAVSLEVAEHLPEASAADFIATLCELAPVVLFSAAIPGQGGVDHLNEQWPAYWCDLFESHGYRVSGALRAQIWNDERVENWYRQNILVAAKSPDLAPTLFDPNAEDIARLPLVHPVLFEHHRTA